MKATARRVSNQGFIHEVDVRSHHMIADEGREQGGDDEGPNPQELLAASLAACTAITMEMYAKRKGWDVAGMEVDCKYIPADRGCVTKFDLVMRMPPHLTEEQVERLQVIAARCPVHRVLEGEVA